MLQWISMTLRAVTAHVATMAGIGLPVLVPAAPASALLMPAAPAPAAAALVATAWVAEARAADAGPQRVCRIGDRRLTELSGLVATASGYVVVNDGSDDPAARKIFYLNGKCAVTRTVSYPSRPRDTEDMGLAADGTLWVADIGDNGENRTTVALWRLAPGAKKPQLFRLSYPDGPHDAEALLLDPGGTPIVVTKTIATAGVYVPASPLRAGKVTPLRRAGSVSLPVTTTSNPFSFPGRLVVTGGAVSPDDRHAVLRTYADAFEFDVSGGDVIGAITEGKPRQIALPDEPQGESVTYTADGTALLTVSEGTDPWLLRYGLPSRPAISKSPSASPSPSHSRSPSPTAAATARNVGFPAGALITGGVLLLAAGALLGVLILRRRR